MRVQGGGSSSNTGGGGLSKSEEIKAKLAKLQKMKHK